MSSATLLEPQVRDLIAESETAKPRKARPVVWWAILGSIFLIEQIYVYLRYFLSLPPNIPAGATHEPWWMVFNIHAQEVVFCAVAVAMLYKFVLLPLIRREAIPFDGLLLVAFMTVIWQNYGINWFGYWSTFNSIVINRGSWYNYVAFWSATPAKGAFAEAPFFDIGVYALMFVMTIWFSFIMRNIRKRWPTIGNVGLFGAIFLFAAVLDFAAEDLWMRGGLYTYPGAPHGWFLIFSGRYYQFPLYECVTAGLLFASLGAVRFYRNDRGQALAEHKLEEVHVGPRRKQLVRFLALAAILNVIYMAYSLTMAVPILHGGGAWPADVQKRSYFVQGICGATTGRACPGPSVPLALPQSAYVDTHGNLAYPPGWVRTVLNVPIATK